MAAMAAGLMGLSLISTPASADSRDNWRGEWRGNYGRHHDCDDHQRSSYRHRDRDNDGWRWRGGDEGRFSWNDRRGDHDWRDGDRDHDRHDGHNRRHRDHDRDGDWR
jgi:hypothetical protein